MSFSTVHCIRWYMHRTDHLFQAADMSSTATLLSLLARLCWEGSDLDLLNAQLVAMSKKHGQLKEAVVRMVDEAMTYLPDLRKKKDAGEYKSGKDRWLELVKTLRDITEGKVGFLGTPTHFLWRQSCRAELAGPVSVC